MNQARWARLLIDSLVDVGVREVVISPGSRSTPFVLAAVQAAAGSDGRVRCFDIIDERAAAYFALGLARVHGRPALLLCTSGTAGANYFPAVVEAGLARVPLVVLTADRPVELVHCGANQTIDQLKLFGDHTRQFFDLGLADEDPRALHGLKRIATQAVSLSQWPDPGAVHLNARARKPLEPVLDPSREAMPVPRVEASTEDAVRSLDVTRILRPRARPAEGTLDALAELCRSTRRGLIVAGPAPIHQGSARWLLVELARLTGFPVLADPTSQLRFGAETGGSVCFVDTYDTLLSAPRFGESMGPELVLQLGRGPVSGAWERFLDNHRRAHHVILAEYGWPDAVNSADGIVVGGLEDTLESLVQRLVLKGPGTDGPWLQTWRRADTLAREITDAVLSLDEDLGESSLSEGRIARTVARRLPSDGLLVVGNSLPVRELDIYAHGPVGPPRVASQRGTSGIDGVVSGAAGAAVAHGGPTALLIGDVSFLHDLSGLGTVTQVPTPLALVVVQNGGGRIFEQLPLASHPSGEGHLDHWITPRSVDLSHAAGLFGLPFWRVEDGPDLERELDLALERPGTTILEAVVPPHGAVEQTRELRRRVADGLSREGIV